MMALRELGLNQWAEATSSWAFTRRAVVSQCRTVHWGGTWGVGVGECLLLLPSQRELIDGSSTERDTENREEWGDPGIVWEVILTQL